MRLALALLMIATGAMAQTSISDEPTAEDFDRKEWTLPDRRKITVTASSAVAGRWRFCTDGRYVTLLPFEASGTTYSVDHIVECESLEHAVKVIEGKKLAIPEVDKQQWNQLLADNGLPHDASAPQPVSPIEPGTGDNP